MVRTQVYFTAEQHRALRRDAESRGISMTEALRQLVDRHLLAKGRAEWARESVFSFVGAGASGLSDVAERHDNYLIEASADADLR